MRMCYLIRQIHKDETLALVNTPYCRDHSYCLPAVISQSYAIMLLTDRSSGKSNNYKFSLPFVIIRTEFQPSLHELVPIFSEL